jgi:precorrin-6B C5,15-methyltransferase / cobalt-precorrin-6B C5,C15-methyltransferase
MITVVGMDGSALGPRAEAALAAATLVAGSRSHLAAVPVLTAPSRARTIMLGELAPALDALAAHDGDAVVLASGDPGFFGIVRALRERGLTFTVLPAVSSVALAFARAGLAWDDAVVVSAHGRDPRPAVNVCRAHPKVAVLTGPGCGPAEIAAALDGWDRRLVVAEHLGRDAERVTECSPAEAASRAWADPNVVLVLAGSPASRADSPAPSADSPEPPRGTGKAMNAAFISKVGDERHVHHERRAAGGAGQAGTGWPEGAGGQAGAGGPVSAGRPEGAGGQAGAGGPVSAGWPEGAGGQADAGVAGPGWLAGTPGAPEGWALSEDAFDSRDAVITKAEVRALALARLGPGPGTLVWDVGAGSGSVGIECARFGAAVIAVERDAVRCRRVQANAARHGVDVRVVPGQAPQVLAELPDPDAVFVGGGGPEVVEAVAARHPSRIVVTLAAVERAGMATAALAAAGYVANGTLVQAARFAPLPSGVHRLAAINPVFLVWGTLAVTTESASAGDYNGPGNPGAGPGALR